MNKPLNFPLASSVASIAMLLIVMPNLTGCGLKGDLYIPTENTQANEAAENPEAVQPEAEAGDDQVADEIVGDDEDPAEDDNANKPKAGKDAMAPTATMETPESTPVNSPESQ